jgi:hypothetical protein
MWIYTLQSIYFKSILICMNKKVILVTLLMVVVVCFGYYALSSMKLDGSKVSQELTMGIMSPLSAIKSKVVAASCGFTVHGSSDEYAACTRTLNCCYGPSIIANGTSQCGGACTGTTSSYFIGQSPATSTSWTFCANEGGTCSFTGTKTVRYGANNSWATGTYTSSVGCNNNVFGDPIEGTQKACYYSDNTSLSCQNHPSTGQACTSAVNACGESTSGTYNSCGVCTATTPTPTPCSVENVCGQTFNGNMCNGVCTAPVGSNLNDSCITSFNITSDNVNPNGSVEFSWSIENKPGVGSRCGFFDLTTPTARPIPGLQNLDPNTDRVRISNIQVTTRFCLVCQFYNLTTNATLGDAAAHQWIRVIRIGEN